MRDEILDTIREKAVGLKNTADEILALCGDARFVLIGEASHGTHEFHRFRAEVTKRLIAEKVGRIWICRKSRIHIP